MLLLSANTTMSLTVFVVLFCEPRLLYLSFLSCFHIVPSVYLAFLTMLNISADCGVTFLSSITPSQLASALHRLRSPSHSSTALHLTLTVITTLIEQRYRNCITMAFLFAEVAVDVLLGIFLKGTVHLKLKYTLISFCWCTRKRHLKKIVNTFMENNSICVPLEKASHTGFDRLNDRV